MKFGKEFTSQTVPEWKEAYMNYNYLKTLLKQIQTFNQRTHSSTNPPGLNRKTSLNRAFSGLIRQRSTQHHPKTPTGSLDIENPVIRINPVDPEGSKAYETTFLMEGEKGGEYELVYFRRLDDEFNKVDKFYRDKVEEVMKEAAALNIQMDALIAFRVKVEDPQGWPWQDRSVEMTRLDSDISASATALAASVPAEARTRQAYMEEIEENGLSRAGTSDNDKDKQKTKNPETKQEFKERNLNQRRVARPPPVEILDRVKLNNTLETPRSTIKSVLKVPNQSELKFTRENLRKVEEKLKAAFIEFYQKLRLLKSYSFLNLLAFSKIMKKYDKITKRNAAKSYMMMVDNSFLGSSDKIVKLTGRVEATFIKHFANANRSKGIGVLRPKAKREKHRVTFLTGIFAGCAFSLLIALFLIIRARKLLDQPGRKQREQYMETMFPLYSLFGFIVLHILMYAANIFYWRRYRVNYSFIFGLKNGTELSHRQVSLLSFCLGTVALVCVLANLDLELQPRTSSLKAFTESLPLILLSVIFVIMVLPFNVLFRSSRRFFLISLFHCICAPLYKVTLPDFFLADQLTSQVQAIRSIQFYVCYYGWGPWGDLTDRTKYCKDSTLYRTLFFFVAVIPYMSRLLQCLRRMFEEKSPEQGYNGLKYFLTILAVCSRTAYNSKQGIVWGIVTWTISAIAAVFSTYWDLIHDWGLLNRNSKNRWLRDKLLVPNKNVYFIAMALNVLLRFAWLQTVLKVNQNFVHQQTMIALVASLEIIRRGIWNFFRLENEHLNNVGKFRAFKSVPLPFSYDEDEDEDD